jgi:proteasome assembly chaperone (PAC2) family protein
VLDPRTLYTLADELPDLDRPVLLHALQGFVDAGGASRMVSDHLLATLEHEVVATFDADQLVDHRSRRPAMLFDVDHYASYATPQLLLHRVRDLEGRWFLLLTGPEPDTQWERFTSAVVQLVDLFGVRTTIGMHAIPMAVPHTRPVGVIGHGTRSEIVPSTQGWAATVQVPGSAGALLELRLGESGHDALGYVVQVPHYVADTAYPEAAVVLLDHVAERADVTVSRAELVEAAEQTRAAITDQVQGSEEVARVVSALEQQYDAYVGSRERTTLLSLGDASLPSADELGAEVERFLAGESGFTD